MASKFSALALRGESFLLETPHSNRQWTILVDGGQEGALKNRGHPLLKAIQQVSPHLTHIDIAICTHSDADHAGGFPTFLEEWLKAGNSIAEVWLPWRWSAILPEALVDPDSVHQKLVIGARQAAVEIETAIRAHPLLSAADAEGHEHDSDLEMVIRNIGRSVLREGAEGIPAEPAPWVDEPKFILRKLEDRPRQIREALGLSEHQHRMVLNSFEETEHAVISLDERATGFGEVWFGHLAPTAIRGESLLGTTLKTAERIRTIAETALRKNVRVRWFDFDAFENGRPSSGGYDGLLGPVNAVEMIRPRSETEPLRLFFSLRLSEQNVESLVFQRFESDSEPAVFFLGDSRLALGINQPSSDFRQPRFLPRRSPIITAAHHGSRVNDRAYEVLDAWFAHSGAVRPYFVRNGGMWKQTLGKFLTKPDRRCAQCQQCFPSERRQHVIIEAHAGNWIWPPAAKICGTPKTNSNAIVRLGLT